MKNDVLYQMMFRNTRIHFQLIVYTPPQREILLTAHGEYGHINIKKIFDRINERNYWPNCLKQIISYISTCQACQMQKNPLIKLSGFSGTNPVQGSFDTVRMDYVGLFVTSSGSNICLLLTIGRLTKWIEIKPVMAPIAANAARFFVEQILFRHQPFDGLEI